MTHPRDRLGLQTYDDDPATIGADPEFVLPRMIERWYRSDPHRPFLTEAETGRTETYGSFRDLTRRWASVLIDHGVESGNCVLSLLPSSIDAHAVWLATSLVGAVEVAVNPDLSGAFLIHALTHSNSAVCIARPDQQPAIADSGVIGLRLILVEPRSSPADRAPVADIADLPTLTDPSCVIYTSGTSGPAKGVVIPWAQLATTIGRIPRSWLSDQDCTYSPWPMFHVTGRSPMTSMADVGGQVVTRERFSLRHFWGDIDKHRCTTTTAGAVAKLLLAEPPDPADRGHSLQHVFLGSGPVGLQFTERFGVNGIACYGSTEVGFPIANPSITADNANSLGWLRPGYEARIVDQLGHDVGPDEPGELLIRPPSRGLILNEYLNEPDKTAGAVIDGWYHTGDVVRLAADDSFTFVDRISDTIRRFGENISSRQLELTVLTHPEVIECAAIGIESGLSGQDVLLCIVAAPGFPLDAARLSEGLADVLPPHMRPRYISLLDELPKTPNGKVRKDALAEQIDLNRTWRSSD